MKETVMMQLETAKWTVHRNLEGVTHDESLRTPEAGGNCSNWVVGHLATAYRDLLKAMGEEMGPDPDTIAPYKRGSGPLDPSQALPLSDLVTQFDRYHDQVMARLAELTEAEMAQLAPTSPRNDPNETIGSLIGLVAFHQAYHAGQIGLQRRVVGREGAIA